MASFDTFGMDELIHQMQLEAERIERNGPDAVMAGGQVGVRAMQETAPERSGGLKKHIKAKGPHYSLEEGHYCDVFPQGNNERGERYATIGFVLEHGRSNMPAHPWMRPAIENNSDAIGDAIFDVLMRD